ncbi:hypothetical protein BV25DRAFT_1912360 [Artomyces pyxidatus]|uniref:Uncharacterized protein n=1 Tax=Artomyces pyxidatus TaxID=48021 RepID=A0ACB8TF03_9AGAM|nr:hypothetical protein BV25DRAFT_1912360 [Artomyces pyxidatus]
MPDASKPINKGVPPAHLVALPSLSSSLSSLPQAKSLANVSLYTSSMAGQHAAQSEAKLKKALSNNATSVNSPTLSYGQLPNSQPTSPSHAQQPLMMRKPNRTKLQA